MATNPLSAAASNAAGGLRQEDFLKLMLKQLLVQNPLQPQDNTAFVAQMAQFSALAQSQALNDNMTQSLLVQSGNQALSLIGKSVTFKNSAGQNSTGIVKTVTFQEGLPVLTIAIGSTNLPGIAMRDVESVSNPPQ